MPLTAASYRNEEHGHGLVSIRFIGCERGILYVIVLLLYVALDLLNKDEIKRALCVLWINIKKNH